MGNIATRDLPQVAFDNIEDILVNGHGTTGRIAKANFIGSLMDGTSDKIFDTLNNEHFKITTLSGEIKVLNLSDDVMTAFNDINLLRNDYDTLNTKVDSNAQSFGSAISTINNNLGQAINNVSSRVTTLESSAHTHENKSVIDLFGTNSEGKLIWNSMSIGSDYELPVATTSALGGVMVDGSTITVNENGVITCINEGTIIADWASNVEYPLGCIVIYETTMYKCLEAHTSGDTFDDTKWKTLTGEKGDAGVSPTAKTEQTDTGATISITDASGTTTSVLSNGITPHIDETTKHWMIGDEDTDIIAEGKNGISPTATVTKTASGATITVVSGEQTTTAELTNGINPHIDSETGHWFIGEEDTGVGGTATIDDTASTGTDVTWSVDKINSVLGDINTILASVTGGIE